MTYLVNAYRSHVGGFRAVRDANAVTVNLTVDVLDGCEHTCPGCFVRKKNPFFEGTDDQTLRQLVEDLTASGFSMDELNIGPTDIFSADNFQEILASTDFIETANDFNLTVVTTLMDESNVIDNRIKQYQQAFIHRERRVEVFVMLDLVKYLANDILYMSKLHRNLKLISDWNVFFLINVYSEDMFEEMNLETLSQRLLDEFGTKLRINPSYFRGTSNRHVNRYATAHKNMLEKNVHGDAIQRVFLNMADMYFNSFTTLNLCYSDGKLSILTFLYEGIPVANDLTIIPKRDGKYHVEDILKTVDNLTDYQYTLASSMDDCSTCKHLTCCISRNTLSYMETRNITNCIVPKDLFRDASLVVEQQAEKTND